MYVCIYVNTYICMCQSVYLYTYIFTHLPCCTVCALKCLCVCVWIAYCVWIAFGSAPFCMRHAPKLTAHASSASTARRHFPLLTHLFISTCGICCTHVLIYDATHILTYLPPLSSSVSLCLCFFNSVFTHCLQADVRLALKTYVFCFEHLLFMQSLNAQHINNDDLMQNNCFYFEKNI